MNFLDDELILVALSDGKTAQLIDVRETAADELTDWLTSLFARHKLVIHNALFDLTWLFHRSGLALVETHDTMVQQQLLQAGLPGPESLVGCIERYFGVQLDKTQQTTFTSDELTDEQLAYAAADVLWTWRLYEAQQPLISEQGLTLPGVIERWATPVFAAMVTTGLCLDQDEHARVIRSYRVKAEELGLQLVEQLGLYHAKRELTRLTHERTAYSGWEAALESMRARWKEEWEEHQARWEQSAGLIGAAAGDPFPAWWHGNKFHDQALQPKYQEPMGLRRFRTLRERDWKAEHPPPNKPGEHVAPLNLNSRDQVLPALADAGIALKDYSADTIFEARVKAKSPSQRQILTGITDYKSNDKAVATYGKLPERLWRDGKLHPEYRQLGAASGRPTGSKPNVMQVKRGPLRKVITPAPGHAFIVCDYSQIELRLLAELSNDPGMIGAFLAGIDIHSKAACDAFGVETPTKEQRTTGKTVNFGIAYGMGAGTLRVTVMEYGIDLAWNDARRMIESWKEESFPVAWQALERWRDHAVEYGWVETAFGRKRWFSPDAEEGSVRREGGNHVIQGTSADITKLAMAAVQRGLLPLGGTVLMNVYDELVSQVPIAQIEAASQVVRDGMLSAARLVLKQVPVEVDLFVTKSWSEEDLFACDG